MALLVEFEVHRDKASTSFYLKIQRNSNKRRNSDVSFWFSFWFSFFWFFLEIFPGTGAVLCIYIYKKKTKTPRTNKWNKRDQKKTFFFFKRFMLFACTISTKGSTNKLRFPQLTNSFKSMLCNVRKEQQNELKQPILLLSLL